MTTHTLTDLEYRERTQAILTAIESQFDTWLEDDVLDADSHRTGGLLEISFPNGSKLVINTQPPLQELWLAAKAGGYHFRFDGQKWVDTREGEELFTSLSRHASLQAGKTLNFSVAA